MDDLSSTILLPIFKSLDSFEIVKIRSVCKKWWEIAEENRTLWRRPILPRREKGWPASTLELFDRKSQSTLEEVRFSLPEFESEEFDLLVQLLGRSKHSLRFLSIHLLDGSHFVNQESPIHDLPWKLPRLEEFKLSASFQVDVTRVPLRWNEFNNRNGSGTVQSLSNLKVLRGLTFPTLFKSHLNLLSSLSSLSVTRFLESSEWRRILEVPSKTLKHLHMSTNVSSDSDIGRLPKLQFPKLKVLQTSSSPFSILPTWLDVPTTLILISEANFPVYLPSVSILCIPDLREIQKLKSRCPLLVELEVGRRSFYTNAERYPELVDRLILVLKERKQQSEDGFKVDGVKMTSLKRLVVPFKDLSAEDLEELRGLVEEVIDLESVSPFFSIEV